MENIIENNTATIYALQFIETKKIFYVGRTISPLPQRLSNHLTSKNKCNSHLHNMLIKLDRSDVEIIELEVCTTENMHFLEEYWIQQMAAWGFSLANIKHFSVRNYVKYTPLRSQSNELKRVCLSAKERTFLKEASTKKDMENIAKINNCSKATILKSFNDGKPSKWAKEAVMSYYKEKITRLYEIMKEIE